jgi:hypothetical protein
MSARLPQWVHIEARYWARVMQALHTGAHLPVGSDALSRAERDGFSSRCAELARAAAQPVRRARGPKKGGAL